MELVVRALRCPPPDQPQAINARFGANGGRIGRSTTCLLPLPSPGRYISRQHLEIRCRDGRYSLKVISRVNGCSVNDSAVPPGSAVELSHGDKIRLGGYLLVAELAGTSAEDPLAAFDYAGSARADSLDRMAALAPLPSSSAARDSWLATSLNGAQAAAPVRHAPPVASLTHSLESAPSGTALGRMLDAARSASGVRLSGSDRSPARGSAFGRDDNDASALDAFLGLEADLPGMSVFAPMSDQAQGLFRQQDVKMAMPAQGNNTLPGSSRVPDEFDDIFSTLDGDLLTGVSVPVGTLALAPAARSAVDGGEALAVLAQALELDSGDLCNGRPLEAIRIVGELLKLTVNGLHQMLEMREQLRNELRIEDRTMIATRENNPLKHSDTARDALRYLVDVRLHSKKLLLQPSKAIGDAIDDICAHEMAVMAGTRAALLASLKMFSPETVEKRIKKSGALDSVVPALHRAKLWESFLAMYGELEKEAEDHFDLLLNQEFARAYAEQDKKLRRGP
jgi:type VI secretion system FHA domain protein